MYPNLYYVFKDLFGVSWKPLGYLNTFGLMVAIAFITAAMVLTSELKRKEKLGLLFPREEYITVGKAVSVWDLVFNIIVGFIFGFKIIGLFANKPDDVTAQAYIFSSEGNLLGGIVVAAILAGLKWWEKKKQQLKQPEQRPIRVWPHDRVGDLVILALVFGILGAKLFDNLENWDAFIANPIERIFSAGGLTFYGGLIAAGIAIVIYARKKNIKLVHLIDSLVPAMMLAYAVGRIGCQVSGDGDWGIYNNAYITDVQGNVALAKPGEFEANLEKNKSYFLEGAVVDPGKNVPRYVTDRTSPSLEAVPHTPLVAPSFLPTWMVAFNYPRNVNNDGILIPGYTEEHNRVLPSPVYPTPFYETIICTVLFLIMWALRKRIFVAGTITGIYFILNGLERYIIERIRVNSQYHLLGFHPSQAQVIAIGLVLFGIAIIAIVQLNARKK